MAVIYNGSDTVTSCSYTTPPDSTQRDEGFARNPLGYIPLLAYGWSLTTWVVKVTLAHRQSEPQVGQQPDVAGPADAAQYESHSACDGQSPTQRGRNRVEAITQPQQTAKLPRATRALAECRLSLGRRSA